ncbi:MmcQ/YjbR family DNA-binding protein [Corallococcus sp. AB004]|uniref:MmcQ/YjbR family DNA-binding protein n=1 Tax=Corallococcus TaxID=83461 RepID=UPI000EA1B21E|nr:MULTISPECIES: MmcQ/YjbR family DNA-binding protein [Corallococcus]RKI36687.1 MmcQ/YjbR family DNA-binding protein [Corallococcus sp. AB004]NPC73637.1 MmcQ/YjbR family DNA-binding protein [Corallococcus exiguus]NPD29644.1 MmcQ/YjbR family DNA-binding protein [Corallococcus exiguus]NRD48168.1 MmcQ/YjbR family DNA-binding protein [Corallococcus exiguus]RKH98930.1 MmcQ/YjbR family DNA-binding protein [Corallococcus sp. AB038B]
MPAENETQKVEAVLREHAMSYPGAHEDFPWGHRAMKVNDKTFLFMTVDGEKLNLSAKLPDSKDAALTLPFTEPTEYGLGKSGWVTAHFDEASQVPVPVIKAWIDESYRAIAPKKLVDQLPARGTAVPGPASKPAKKAAASKKPSVRQAVAPAKKAAKKVVGKVKAVAKKAVARVKTVAKKASKKVAKTASAAKAKTARKAPAPARGKRAASSAPKRARRS